MNNVFTSDWTVRDVLSDCPDSEQVFFVFGTDCVGCWLKGFCTLNDVSGAYALEISELMITLQESSDKSIQRRMI